MTYSNSRVRYACALKMKTKFTGIRQIKIISVINVNDKADS